MINLKQALVLAGGGSKGAYQAGCIKALIELGYNFNIVTGTSVGALNGLLVVQKDYEESIGEYHQDILLEWEKAKNKTSHDIRIFFYYINKKYGTDFPDDLPDDL